MSGQEGGLPPTPGGERAFYGIPRSCHDVLDPSRIHHISLMEPAPTWSLNRLGPTYIYRNVPLLAYFPCLWNEPSMWTVPERQPN